jgi:hypothetical protein
VKLAIKSVTSVKVVSNRFYVIVSDEGEKCRIIELGDDVKNVAFLSGVPCSLLLSFRDNLLVSTGNILYTVSNDGAKPILRARHDNWFWHAVEARGKVIQEYGESPTSIYVSEDLENFRLLASNKDMDPLSKHFHYIAFDATRNILIAAFGMETLLGLLYPLIVDIARGLYTKVRGNSFLYLLRRIGGYFVLIPVLRGVV